MTLPTVVFDVTPRLLGGPFVADSLIVVRSAKSLYEQSLELHRGFIVTRRRVELPIRVREQCH